jgi:acetyl esterase/lipase
MWAGRILRGIVALALMLSAVAMVFAVREAHAAELRSNAVALRSRTIAQRTDEMAHGRYRDQVFGSVTVVHDVAYDGSLKLDVYAPAGDSDHARAAVAWFHPGGFTEGDKAKEADLATDLAKRGYVVFVPDYSLNPKLQWFDMDGRIAAARFAGAQAQQAIAFIHSHAKQYGVDPTLVFAGGYSAGAIVAFDLDYANTSGPASVTGAFTIAGYTNLIPPAGAGPVLDFHGSNDLLIPNALGQTACASAVHAGDVCKVETFDGLGHEVGYSQRAVITDRASSFLASVIAAQ